MKPRCEIDQSVTRVEAGGFAFPLGVYPIEELTPKPGFVSEFEHADGGDVAPGPGGEAEGDPGFEGAEDGPAGGLTGGPVPGIDYEPWPDRYLWDVVIPAPRLPALVRTLVSMLPPRVFAILDFIGHDAHREVDPYIGFEPIGVDALMDGIIQFGPFLFEDGMCGFGAMCEDPFVYLLVDEHKIVTVRAEPAMKDQIDEALDAFGLRAVAEPAGADATSHEHRSVLTVSAERPDLMSPEEIVEHLRDAWRLGLNVDSEANLDDEGRELGATPWRVLVRCDPIPPEVEAGAEDESESGAEEGSGGDSEVDGAGSGPAEAVSGAGDPPPPEAEPQTEPQSDPQTEPRPPAPIYAELFLIAERLSDAEEMAYDAVMPLLAGPGDADDAEDTDVGQSPRQPTRQPPREPVVITADRMTKLQLDEAMTALQAGQHPAGGFSSGIGTHGEPVPAASGEAGTGGEGAAGGMMPVPDGSAADLIARGGGLLHARWLV